MYQTPTPIKKFITQKCIGYQRTTRGGELISISEEVVELQDGEVITIYRRLNNDGSIDEKMEYKPPMDIIL